MEFQETGEEAEIHLILLLCSVLDKSIIELFNRERIEKEHII